MVWAAPADNRFHYQEINDFSKNSPTVNWMGSKNNYFSCITPGSGCECTVVDNNKCFSDIEKCSCTNKKIQSVQTQQLFEKETRGIKKVISPNVLLNFYSQIKNCKKHFMLIFVNIKAQMNIVINVYNTTIIRFYYTTSCKV